MRIDPEENELHNLARFAPLAGRRVLDIGCGDGSFTCEYAGLTEWVIGVDPDLSDLHIAIHSRLDLLSDRVQFLASRAQSLPFASGSFDTAIFTSSL